MVYDIWYMYIQWTLVLANMVFNKFLLVIYRRKSLGLFIFDYEKSNTNPWSNERRFSRILHYIEQKYRFPPQIMDLANSIIFLSFEVYLQLLRCSSKFELKKFSFKCLAIWNYFVVTMTMQLYYNCILWKMTGLKRKRLSLSNKY